MNSIPYNPWPSNSTVASNGFCPHCYCPGVGIHYSNCPYGQEHDADPVKTLICLLDGRALAAIREIVREELERQHAKALGNVS